MQACLLFSSLDLLPVWTDELFTIKTVARPVQEIIPIVQRDIHPPLYFIVLRGWQKLPLPWTGVASLRAFSVVWALIATLLLDLFWAHSWKPFARWLSLSLFALSPCLLLYGRMARSYTMQVAFVLLSVGLAQRWMRKPRSWLAACGAFAAMLGLLYTHYVPGVAVLAGFTLISWRLIGAWRAVLFLLSIGAGYFPWLITLTGAIQRWQEAGSYASSYNLTGNPVLEQLVKISFGVVSLTIGESFLLVSLVLVPVMVVFAVWGMRSVRFSRQLTAMLGIAAGVGYFGVARWASYPFIPARLLWLLPFLSMAIAVGMDHVRRPPVRHGIVLAMLLSYVSSGVLYFRRENFLNLGYTAPLPEIAATINDKSQRGDLILLDYYNSDSQALEMYLSGRTPVVVIEKSNVAAARRAIRSAGTIWIVRNTRDISPGELTSRLQSEACAGRREQDDFLEPYAHWQEVALKLVGFDPPPTHFYQVTTCVPVAATDKLKGGNK